MTREDLLTWMPHLEADADRRGLDTYAMVANRAIAMIQRDGEAIAAMTGERDRLREAASNAAHQLEQARIWNGSGWHWNHLRADVALHAWGILQEALREGGE